MRAYQNMSLEVETSAGAVSDESVRWMGARILLCRFG